MSNLSVAKNSSTNALRKLQALGLVFTNEAFVAEFALAGNLQNVALFVEAGIDVNMPVDGAPPIVWIASFRRGDCEIAQLLIDNGADVNAANLDGVSAIQMAVLNEHTELVRLLIESGANLNSVSQEGFTVLDRAKHYGHEELVQLLIEHGAEPGPQTAFEDEMSERLEITNIVERLELLEENFGIALSALYANYIYRPQNETPHFVTINFDVTSTNGGKLERSLHVRASAYNEAGQMLETCPAYIDGEEFVGYGSYSIHLFLDQSPAKIRLFPSV